MKTKRLFIGALVLAIGGFITKVLGALYRVPLAKLLGAEGLGVYQMAFPVYALLCEISSAGVPNALARAISKENDGEEYLKSSLKIFGAIGVLLGALLFIFSRQVAIFLGDESSLYIYKTFAPAVVIVPLIASFRGYFQGGLKMYPTALSQIIEQVAKIAVGILLIKSVNDAKERVIFAGASVAIAEFFALIFLVILFFVKRKKSVDAFCRLDKDNTLTVLRNSTKTQNNRQRAKGLFLSVLPITLLSLTLPLSQVIDCSIIIRALSKMRADARGIYGVYSGGAMAIVNLPVTVCFALATVAVPAIAKRDGARKSKAKLLLLSTLVLSFLGALCCYLFSPLAVRLLFSGFSSEYQAMTVMLVRALSLNVIFSAMLQTINSILIGVGKTSKALVGLIVGVIVKTTLTVIFINFTNLGILVMPITVTLCNLLACFINLLYIKKYANQKNHDGQTEYKK